MRKRNFIVFLILVILFVILTKYNGAAKSFFFNFINPIKSAYLNLTDLSSSYLSQKEKIRELEKINSKLNIVLIEQSNYIQELSKIYRVLPSLVKKPYKSIYMVNAISYVKLNRLNEIMLTTPKNLSLEENHPYGLMQNDVASGVARYKDGKLYGYLLSYPKCTFSVVIGKDRINGVAQGDGSEGMIIKFIPRWSKIEIGDIVRTSGLDNIFYPDIPVGKVTDIKVLDRYQEVKIKIFANINKPSIFFLISDPRPYLTTDYTPETSFPNRVYPFVPTDKQNNINSASQTKENVIEPQSIDEQDYLKLLDSRIIWQNQLQFEQNEDKNTSNENNQTFKKFNLTPN